MSSDLRFRDVMDRLTKANPEDELITRAESSKARAIFVSINYASLILIGFTLSLMVVLSDDKINNICNLLNCYKNSYITGVVIDNINYLEHVKPALGQRYSIVYVLSATLVISIAFISMVLAAFSRNFFYKKVSGFHMKAIAIYFIVFLTSIAFLALFDITPGANRSHLQAVFDTEWSMVTIAFLFWTASSGINYTAFGLARLIKAGREARNV
jgi:hypothetical protein